MGGQRSLKVDNDEHFDKCSIIPTKQTCSKCSKTEFKIYKKTYTNKNNILQSVFVDKQGSYWQGNRCPTCSKAYIRGKKQKPKNPFLRNSLLQQQMREFERSILVKALNETEGNQLKAAEKLGITRELMNGRVKSLKIKLKTKKIQVTNVKYVTVGAE